jgi:hypothetical protein
MGIMDKVKGWFGGKQEEATQGMSQPAGAPEESTGGSPGGQTMSAADQPTDTGETPGDDA